MLIRHAFVETIPDRLEPGVLYVSFRFRTAVHLCPTGCGEEVVTPLARNDWTLVFDGRVSLRPSVGNWSLACRSHYWITSDEIIWAWTRSREDVARWRDLDRRPGISADAGRLDRLWGWARRRIPGTR